MAVTVTANFSAARQLIEQLKSVKEKAIYVGVPAEKNSQVEGGINLATLAMILQRGGTITPKRAKALVFGKGKKRFFAKSVFIPARPFIEQTINENQDKYVAKLAEFIQQGKTPLQAMNSVALMAEEDIKKAMKDKKRWAPNSKLTVAIKGSSTPLIHNGHLRKSITGLVK
ncbi:hypothetical protein [Pasteurella bettyae]|uniref:hypothetical protein n=1 Tax=Pasteurella bettyae TaxID=752 RepID=UPI003D286262